MSGAAPWVIKRRESNRKLPGSHFFDAKSERSLNSRCYGGKNVLRAGILCLAL